MDCCQKNQLNQNIYSKHRMKLQNRMVAWNCFLSFLFVLFHGGDCSSLKLLQLLEPTEWSKCLLGLALVISGTKKTASLSFLSFVDINPVGMCIPDASNRLSDKCFGENKKRFQWFLHHRGMVCQALGLAMILFWIYKVIENKTDAFFVLLFLVSLFRSCTRTPFVLLSPPKSFILSHTEAASFASATTQIQTKGKRESQGVSTFQSKGKET